MANDSSNTVTVIDGATKATATVVNGNQLSGIAVNAVTNKIYVTNEDDDTVTVIDGATNTTATVSTGTGPGAVAVNPLTVLAEQPVWPKPFQAGITPLTGNATGTLIPSFNFSASSAFATYAPPPDNLLFQLDTWQGAWTAATPQGNGAFSGQFASALQPGFHILYAYSTDGQEATSVLASTASGGGTNPLISNIKAYGFLMAPSAATLSPADIDFSSQTVGVPSASQTLTLSNSGGPLAIFDVTITGANSGDFSELDNCNGGLAAGGNCTLGVTFTPSTSSAESATLTVTDDSGGVAGTAQTVNLTGTGSGTTVGLSPSSLSFSSQLAGTQSPDKTVTVTNTGTANLVFSGIYVSSDFVIDTTTPGATTCSTSTPVTHAGTCKIAVAFAPSQACSLSGALTFTDNRDTSPQTAALTGTGIAPALGLSSSSMSYGSQVVGNMSAAQQVEITNTGTSVLIFSSLAASGDFNVDSFTTTCFTSTPLGTTSSCFVGVTFTPAAAGARTGSLSIACSAGTSDVRLTGTGIAPGVSLNPSSLTFGSTVVGTTAAAKSVVLTNTGTSPLTLTAITPSGDFALDASTTCSTSSPVAANGGSCTIAVTFSPAAIGTRTGTIIITDDASGGTQTIALSGPGTAPGVSLDPSSITCGSMGVGTIAAAKSVTLTNTGTSPLTLTAITPSGDFSLAAGTQAVSLNGAGFDFNLTLPSGSSTTQSVQPGQTATYALSMGSLGDMTQTVSFTCTGAPYESICTVSPNPASPGSNVTVTVTTTGRSSVGPRRFTLPLWPNYQFLLVFSVLCGTMGWGVRARKRVASNRVAPLLLFLAALSLALALTSCGGGGIGGTANPGTPAGSYTLTLTGTSGSGSSALSHSMNLVLTIS